MDTKSLNLDIITKQYRHNSKAAKGYELLMNLLGDYDSLPLETLLRNHRLNPILIASEIEGRENVDTLMDYYSILQITLLANYINHPLPENLANEIDVILETPAVKKYFEEYYPLVLPQLLIKQIHTDEYLKNNIEIDSTPLFDRFLILNHFVKSDEDIQLLLWFFDDGWIGKYSLKDFIALLRDKTKMLNEYSNKTHPLNKVLWGFTKYTQFLTDYAELIRDCYHNSILQSAIWHYHGYWFNKIENKIGTNLKLSIQSIKDTFAQFNSKELIYDQHSYLTSIDEIREWKSNISHLDTIEQDIDYLFNTNLGQPINELNHRLNSN